MRYALAALLLVVAPPVFADEFQTTFQSTLTAVSARPDCTKAEYPDLLIITCDKDMALWYFTKPNNAAYPGIVKRSIIQDPDGAVSAREDGRSYGDDEAQPAFKAWMASIVALDQKVKEELAREHASH
jgi:hypothetical protein